jgi:hypothetical protein
VYIQQLGEMIPPPSQNTAAVCHQVALLILITFINFYEKFMLSLESEQDLQRARFLHDMKYVERKL